MLYIENMATEPTYTVKKLVAMTPEMAERIDAYRFEKRIKSESEAIRLLIDQGLEASRECPPKSANRETSDQLSSRTAETPEPAQGKAPFVPRPPTDWRDPSPRPETPARKPGEWRNPNLVKPPEGKSRRNPELEAQMQEERRKRREGKS